MKRKRPQILLTLDFDPETGERPEVQAMEYFLQEILPQVEKRLKLVVNCSGLALELLKQRNKGFDIFKDLVAEDMLELGNHTYSHPSITGEYTGTKPLSYEQQEKEIALQNELIMELFGKRPVVFRAPYFNHNKHTLEILSKNQIKFDLSKYIAKDEFRATKIIKRKTRFGNIFSIPTNMKLSPKVWVEPIQVFRPKLIQNGLHNIVFHPYELTEAYSHYKETRDNFFNLISQDVQFVHCKDLLG